MTTVMEWRSVYGFPSYDVSECGDVRRSEWARTREKGWRLRGFINQDGYLTYTLINERGEKISVTAHKLVALTFLGPPPLPDAEVAHNNGSRVDCRYQNLRWASRLENHRDIQMHGTALRGEVNPKAKVTEQQVKDIRREYREIKESSGKRSVSELDIKYGLNRATIVKIAKGRSWAHVPMPW